MIRFAVSFRASKLKIERANKHISDLENRIRSFPNEYIVRIKRDAEAGKDFLEHGTVSDTIVVESALIIGDAIHNLKCALDFAWISTIEKVAPPALSSFAKFPVRDSRYELETALQGREIHTSSPALFDLMVFGIKSYDGGNDSIWAIHRLDILDKHKLLIPLWNIGSVVDMELEDEQGHVVPGPLWGTTRPGLFCAEIPQGFHIKNKGNVAVEVVFDDGTPTEDLEVCSALSGLSEVALSVIELLEKL